MKEIDLHIHSNYSDGTDSPEEIVIKARDKKIDLIALTDHNTLDGINDFKIACLKYHQKALAGIEISSYYHNQEIHLLGYYNLETDFNLPKYQPLKDLIDEYQEIKVHQNEAILDKLIAKYPQLSNFEFYQFCKTISKRQNLNRVHIAKYLVYKNVVPTTKIALDEYINEGGPFFVSKQPIDLFKAIDTIKKTAGLAVVAHLGEYHFDINDKRLFLNECYHHQINGFECYHPLNTLDDINLIHSFYTQHTTMILTAGSDYHGKNKKHNYLGVPCNLTLSAKDKKQYDLIREQTYKSLQKLF
ncbi:PHP domain-containing protein [uncultured Thomasclavelia sp.]|uniref:PHP domain-containing protein n=1 Tax=uncultured Thomasclavelia sp. TaxID=3025759 RepID=UPI0025FD3EB0|nr:PHP domain-containing protein [uncultured Thomasclavelia sp.]